MDELTPAEIDELRAALSALRDELEAVLDASRSGAKPVDRDEPIGRLSRMDAIQQQQMIVASRAQQQQRLVAVRQALRAVEDGRHGQCRRCEEPIGIARLRARPEASLCRDCQDELEARR